MPRQLHAPLHRAFLARENPAMEPMSISTGNSDSRNSARDQAGSESAFVSWKGVGLLVLVFASCIAIGLLFYSEEVRFTVDESQAQANEKTDEKGLRDHLFAEEAKVSSLQQELQAAQSEILTQRSEIGREEQKLDQMKRGTYKGKYQRVVPTVAGGSVARLRAKHGAAQGVP